MVALSEQLTQGYAEDRAQECAECHHTLDQIEIETGKRQMFLHWKDEVQELLCPRCSAAYEVRATNLYSDTLYGRAKKLSGYR
jgi:hypothetical protein